MLRLTSNPSFFLFLFLFLFLFSTTVISIPLHSLRLRDGGVENDVVDKKNDEVVLSMKSVAEDGSYRSNSNRTTLVLAQQRTLRKDFFNHFHRYTGGWNITNPYYISSLISTSVPYFAVAASWFLIFGILLHLICVSSCCCCSFPQDPPHPNSKSGRALSLLILIILPSTVLAIGGCVVLYYNQREFYGTTSNTVDFVAGQAQFTAQNLRNVSNYFDSAKQIATGLGLPQNIEKEIDHVKIKINAAATVLSNKTGEKLQLLHRGIDGMRLTLIIVAAVMLFLTVLVFMSSIYGLQCITYSLVVVGWILIAGTFILCGAFLLLHNAIADTCVAMDEWVANPTPRTALDEILPCVENATALETFLKSKTVTYLLVNSVDNMVSDVLNGNNTKKPYNQSGPPVPLLCNPFNKDYTTRRCAAGEIAFENTIEVWKNYICEASSLGICVSPGRMIPSVYTQLTAAVNVTHGLYHYGPFLVDLVDCAFVRKTFRVISNNYCPGLERYSKWIYWGLVVVSAAGMLLLIFWIIYERDRSHHPYIRKH